MIVKRLNLITVIAISVFFTASCDPVKKPNTYPYYEGQIKVTMDTICRQGCILLEEKRNGKKNGPFIVLDSASKDTLQYGDYLLCRGGFEQRRFYTKDGRLTEIRQFVNLKKGLTENEKIVYNVNEEIEKNKSYFISLKDSGEYYRIHYSDNETKRIAIVIGDFNEYFQPTNNSKYDTVFSDNAFISIKKRQIIEGKKNSILISDLGDVPQKGLVISRTYFNWDNIINRNIHRSLCKDVN